MDLEPAARPDEASAIVVDTQVVSYAMKGSGELPHLSIVPSTVAHELLLMREPASGRPRYFLPALGRQTYRRHPLPDLQDHPTHMPLFKRVSDQLTIDFAGDFQSVLERSHQGVSSVLENRERDILLMAIRHLPKPDQQKILKRFGFLAELPVESQFLAVRGPHVEVALGLLDELIVTGGNPKNNFRNTLNDMLILAVAISVGALWTCDKELVRIARTHLPLVGQFGEVYRFEAPTRQAKPRVALGESKGYINRGWSYTMRK